SGGYRLAVHPLLRTLFLLDFACPVLPLPAAVQDTPFLQDRSVKCRLAPALTNAVMRRLEIDRDGVVYVLTDQGVARLFEDTLVLDRSFRPLTGLVARDI